MFAPIFTRLRSFTESNGERLSKIAVGFTGLATAGMLVFHFSMTLLHVAPDNPFRDQVFPVVDAYMTPYFTQNWKLFAPTPEEPSKHIGVVCRFGASGLADTEVIDITAPHYEHLHHYRLSPSQRVIRAQVYPLTRVHPPKDMVTTAVEKLSQSDKEEDREIAKGVEQAKDSRKAGMRLLGRVASAECDRRFPDTQVSEVQLLYFHERAPKFSKRNQPDAKGEIASLDYGWLPYEKVATY
jgi:hypothetical protein